MKQFLDYIPLLVFISVWAMDERLVNIAGFEHSIGGIFSAAEFLIAASILVYGSLFLIQKRLDKFQWITLIAVLLFCIPTIIFRNITFLKLKAPIVFWIFAMPLPARFYTAITMPMREMASTVASVVLSGFPDVICESQGVVIYGRYGGSDFSLNVAEAC
ncbi:MAG: septation protein IspZ, partial [Proteobacteria bacterium]|nr:septation protein IspZ [Pseudomonadota bacterium]